MRFHDITLNSLLSYSEIGRVWYHDEIHRLKKCYDIIFTLINVYCILHVEFYYAYEYDIGNNIMT